MEAASFFQRAFRRLGTLAAWVRKVFAIISDEWMFRRMYPDFRTPTKNDGGPPVLLISFNNWIPRAVLDGVLCKGLQLRGENVVVLSDHQYRTPQRRLRAFGLQQFVQFDDYMERAKIEWPDARIQEVLPKQITFASLHAFTINGVGVGRHVLSTVVRNLMTGSVQFDSPEVQKLLAHFLPLSIRTAAAAHLIMQELKPKTVLFLEKGYTPYGEFFDEALQSGADVIQYFHAHRSDLLMMKRYQKNNRFVHPFSLSAKSWQQVQEHQWAAHQEEDFMKEMKRSYEEGTWFNRKFLLKGKTSKTPEEIRTQLGLDPSKKTAVVFSHVLWDATFFFGENLFPDYETWLIETVRVACKNTAVNWVIKLHPDYVWKMQQMGPHASPRDVLALEGEFGTLPPHIHVVAPDTDISTHAFFPITDYCITVRGTIGIEAPCFGIPVFTAGTGRYSGLGFTNDSRTREEYLEKLLHIQDVPALTSAETTLGRKHAWGLFHCRPLQFTTCEIVSKTRKTGFLDHDVVLRASTAKELSQAEDLQKFLTWVIDSRDEDYLNLAA